MSIQPELRERLTLLARAEGASNVKSKKIVWQVIVNSEGKSEEELEAEVKKLVE